MENNQRFDVTVERFTGFGQHYNDMRPSPPDALAPLLSRLARCPQPQLVVDIGCGTGLSTRYWGQHAASVIGVDPTDAMLEAAKAVGGDTITYRKGYSHETGLPEGCADMVVCSQALHWMDPESTFKEARRLLRPGGLFAACDYDWPPATGFWEVDAAYVDCIAHCHRLEESLGVSQGLQRWSKEGHLERIEQSGQFRYAREYLLHHQDSGDTERLIGLVLSQGHVQTLLKHGQTTESLKIEALRELAEDYFQGQTTSWFWSSRVRVGIR